MATRRAGLFLPILVPLLVIPLLTCSGDDDEKPEDSGPGGEALVDTGPAVDKIGVVEAFGEVCTNVGLQCKKKSHAKLVLWCIALKGGSTGKGFCTPTCTDIGTECYDVPNGQSASCSVETEKDDAGASTKYCAFYCKLSGKTYTCPGQLKCGKPNSQGQAACVQ